MTQELVKVEQPQLPECWDYEESVKRIKGNLYKWKNLTIEIAQELWIAREKLRTQGQRTDLTSGKNTRSWTDYCKEIGSERRTVNNWLNRFFPPELPELPKVTGPYDETADIREGKFEELEKDIPDDSIDAIITDPPYGDEYLHVWEDLSRIGSRILKPGGWLITYSGKLHLASVIDQLCEHLDYYWMLALKLQGGHKAVHPRKVFDEWKPILIFQKLPFRRTDDYFGDLITGSGRDKSLHEWQQSEGEMEKIIDIFTKPGDLILDPYCGTGTFLVAAQQLRRKIMGIDQDPECIKIMKSRLYKALENKESPEFEEKTIGM